MESHSENPFRESHVIESPLADKGALFAAVAFTLVAMRDNSCYGALNVLLRLAKNDL